MFCSIAAFTALQAEQMVQEVMREQRHRFWRWWDDAQPRGTQFSRAGGCAPRRHCFCHYFMFLALWRYRSRCFHHVSFPIFVECTSFTVTSLPLAQVPARAVCQPARHERCDCTTGHHRRPGPPLQVCNFSPLSLLYHVC